MILYDYLSVHTALWEASYPPIHTAIPTKRTALTHTKLCAIELQPSHTYFQLMDIKESLRL